METGQTCLAFAKIARHFLKAIALTGALVGTAGLCGFTYLYLGGAAFSVKEELGNLVGTLSVAAVGLKAISYHKQAFNWSDQVIQKSSIMKKS